MKKRVDLSTYCVIITVLSVVVIAGIVLWLINQNDSPNKNILILDILAILTIWCFLGLFYAPVWLRLTDKSLDVVRYLKVKSIPIDQIKSVRLCPPTMGEKRICGSGGFAGYWGWFSEKDLGKYFAYYGKASDCFLVTLKNGKKYMLSCKDAPEMVDAISQKYNPV